MRITPGIAASLASFVLLGAHDPAHAGVVAEETMVMDLLQMITMDTRVITSIEGNKARQEFILRMKHGQSSADAAIHTTDIHRLDRGVVYTLNEADRQYRENMLGSPAPAMDSMRQIAAIASGLQCQWASAEIAKTDVGEEAIGGMKSAHVRIEASRRCVATTPAASSCTLAITYDQWNAHSSELHAELARYRHDYAAKAGLQTGIAEDLKAFSQFGVPVDPILVESIRQALALDGQALKAHTALRASRSCFVPAEGPSQAATAPTEGAQSDPSFLFQFMGGMLLSAWAIEKGLPSAEGSADRPETLETLGTIATELTAIRAEKLPASHFELPAGFTKAP